MRSIVGALIAALLLVAPARATGLVEFTFSAPLDRVWDKTEAVLKILGWDLDKVDRSIGFMVTESRRLDGDNE